MASLEQRISFRKCTAQDQALMRSWWDKPHVREFWDNSPEMWDNFIHYIQGKKEIFDYWIGSLDEVPFCLVMTSQPKTEVIADDPYPCDHIIPWLDPTEKNLGFDFLIGEESFLGKGLSYRALRQFMETIGSFADAYFIDPEVSNKKAIHVYERAGFEAIANFVPKTGNFKDKEHLLMRYRPGQRTSS